MFMQNREMIKNVIPTKGGAGTHIESHMKTYPTSHPPVFLRKIFGIIQDPNIITLGAALTRWPQCLTIFNEIPEKQGIGIFGAQKPFSVRWKKPAVGPKLLLGQVHQDFSHRKKKYKTPQQWNTCLCSRWLFCFVLWDSLPLNHHWEVLYPTTLGKSKPVLNGWDNSIYRNYKVLVTHVLSAMYRGPITPCVTIGPGPTFTKGAVCYQAMCDLFQPWKKVPTLITKQLWPPEWSPFTWGFHTKVGEVIKCHVRIRNFFV